MDKLIAFGASSVAGVGDSQGGFFRRLEKKLAEAGKPYEYLNFGVGGNTTKDMVARLGVVEEQLPARVIILLGCNDMPRENDATPERRTRLGAYEDNVKTIIEVLGGPGSIFISSFAVSPEQTGILQPTFEAYMSAALWTAKMRGMTIWNLFDASLDWEGRFLAPDGVHYNDAGHEMIADNLFSLLESHGALK